MIHYTLIRNTANCSRRTRGFHAIGYQELGFSNVNNKFCVYQQSQSRFSTDLKLDKAPRIPTIMLTGK
jgi:hypothetical protein